MTVSHRLGQNSLLYGLTVSGRNTAESSMHSSNEYVMAVSPVKLQGAATADPILAASHYSRSQALGLIPAATLEPRYLLN